MEKFTADAPIQPDPACNFLHVGTTFSQRLATSLIKVILAARNVLRVFDEFGGFDFGVKYWRFHQVKRPV